MSCLWPLDISVLPVEWDDMDLAAQDRAHALASATLHRLTGGRVGHCAVTIRPNVSTGRLQCVNAASRWWEAGRPVVSPRQLVLPPPVGRIDEVTVDGNVIPDTDYTIYDGNLLVYTGALEAPFPPWQDLHATPGSPGTYTVTYLNAYPVDSGGMAAAAIMAGEFAKAYANQGRCRLPAGTQQVVRAGVSFTVVPGTFPEGRTGIPEVDSWVALWNPRALRHDPVMWSPDMPAHLTITQP